MSFDALLGMTQRLNVSVEALAALAAYLRLRTEQRDPGPEVATLLQTVVTAYGRPRKPQSSWSEPASPTWRSSSGPGAHRSSS